MSYKLYKICTWKCYFQEDMQVAHGIKIGRGQVCMVVLIVLNLIQ